MPLLIQNIWVFSAKKSTYVRVNNGRRIIIYENIDTYSRIIVRPTEKENNNSRIYTQHSLNEVSTPQFLDFRQFGQAVKRLVISTKASLPTRLSLLATALQLNKRQSHDSRRPRIVRASEYFRYAMDDAGSQISRSRCYIVLFSPSCLPSTRGNIGKWERIACSARARGCVYRAVGFNSESLRIRMKRASAHFTEPR